MKRKGLFAVLSLLMFILGASDSLRGVFSPLFRNSFMLTEPQMGMMLSSSYLGTLIFLLLGGVILDKAGLKRGMTLFTLLMALSEILLMFSGGFLGLSLGFLLTLGISTLLNTTVSISSSRIGSRNDTFIVNLLFAIQGIGAVLSQLILPSFSGSRIAWGITLLLFTLVLIPLALAIGRMKGLEEVKSRDNEALEVTEKKNDWISVGLIALALSFYVMAEHATTNWVLLYAGDVLGTDAGIAGKFLALFTAGILIGRVLFSTTAQKIGNNISCTIAMALTAVFSFFAFRSGALFLLLFMGLSASVVYPTMMSRVKDHVKDGIQSRATTGVIAFTAVSDIAFNAWFGSAMGNWGMRSMMILLSFIMALGAVTAGVLTARKGR